MRDGEGRICLKERPQQECGAKPPKEKEGSQTKTSNESQSQKWKQFGQLARDCALMLVEKINWAGRIALTLSTKLKPPWDKRADHCTRGSAVGSSPKKQAFHRGIHQR